MLDGQAGRIVVGAQVTEEHVAKAVVAAAAQQRGCLVVGQVAVFSKNAPFERRRVGTRHQHIHVVVRLDHEMVGKRSIAHRLVGHLPQVGHHRKTLAVERKMVTDGLCGVVGHDERRNAQIIADGCLFTLFQITDTALEPACRAEIGAQGLLQRPGQIDRPPVSLGIGPETLDMVEVVVRHENGIDRVERDVVLGEPLLDGAGPNADIDEESGPAVSEIIAVAIAAARQTQEPDHPYLPFFLRFLISRGRRIPFSVTMPAISDAGVMSKAGLYTRTPLGAIGLL